MSRGIAHLDLKLDNIFVSSAADSANSSSLLKIGDFGLAAFTSWPFKEEITHFVGTKGYQAPEILVAKPSFSGQAADLFAVGVILFCLVTGHTPFNEATRTDP